MKVILTEEIIGLGEPGKIIDVAPGYARNYLVPRKLAVYANEGRVKELEHNKRRLERKRQALQAAAMSTAEKINAAQITIDAHAGQGGRLFGSVTTHDIADALKAQAGVEVDRRKLHQREPIRTLGTFQVDVHLIGETKAVANVTVVDTTHPVEAAPEPAAAPAPAPVEAAPADEAGE